MKRTGAKRRSVQLWADAGALVCLPQTDRMGTGNHRLFDETEMTIAAILRPLAAWGLPIGALRRVAEVLRQALVAGPLVEHGAHEIARIVERARAGEGVNFLEVAHVDTLLVLGVVADESGPAVIDPVREFPDLIHQKGVAVMILNMTPILRGLSG